MIQDLVFSPEIIGNCDNPEKLVFDKLSRKIGHKNSTELFIHKYFIDARHKYDVKVIYRAEFLNKSELNILKSKDYEEALVHMNSLASIDLSDRPVIVGFGPAGMFAGLVLAKYGLKPIIIERGSQIEKRVADVNSVRAGGIVNPESNVQFGEGGAGTFSDGKLYTGVSSGLKGFIASKMVEHGASPTIMYDSHPHVGTDVLRDVVTGIRKEIISLGGEILFDNKLTRINTVDKKVVSVETSAGTINCSRLILAIGHSSRDTFRTLFSDDIAMENKAFSVGVRIEHKREMIDVSQYGFDTSKYKNISAANYKLAVDTNTGRKLYTFCMCPGGEVVAAQSSAEAICTNGMSYSKRDLENSNSALLVPINSFDYGEEVLSGMYYQERLENLAYISGGKSGYAPIMSYGDLCGNNSVSIASSFKPGTSRADFSEIFSPVILDSLKDGINLMGKKIKGFNSPDSVLTAVEARSSSPVRILRDRDTNMSLSTYGLFPCGEGAGYAGGIMSSAIDGIKCANALVQSMID